MSHQNPSKAQSKTGPESTTDPVGPCIGRGISIGIGVGISTGISFAVFVENKPEKSRKGKK